MEDAALSKLSETTAVNHCLEGIVDSREKLGENKGAEKTHGKTGVSTLEISMIDTH